MTLTARFHERGAWGSGDWGRLILSYQWDTANSRHQDESDIRKLT